MTREQAIQQVYDAWSVEGPRADIHHQAQRDLLLKWPKLAGAVATLVATIDAERARPTGDNP